MKATEDFAGFEKDATFPTQKVKYWSNMTLREHEIQLHRRRTVIVDSRVKSDGTLQLVVARSTFVKLCMKQNWSRASGMPHLDAIIAVMSRMTLIFSGQHVPGTLASVSFQVSSLYYCELLRWRWCQKKRCRRDAVDRQKQVRASPDTRPLATVQPDVVVSACSNPKYHFVK